MRVPNAATASRGTAHHQHPLIALPRALTGGLHQRDDMLTTAVVHEEHVNNTADASVRMQLAPHGGEAHMTSEIVDAFHRSMRIATLRTGAGACSP
jgi:hypothetical protein